MEKAGKADTTCPSQGIFWDTPHCVFAVRFLRKIPSCEFLPLLDGSKKWIKWMSWTEPTTIVDIDKKTVEVVATEFYIF